MTVNSWKERCEARPPRAVLLAHPSPNRSFDIRLTHNLFSTLWVARATCIKSSRSLHRLSSLDNEYGGRPEEAAYLDWSSRALDGNLDDMETRLNRVRWQ